MKRSGYLKRKSRLRARKRLLKRAGKAKAKKPAKYEAFMKSPAWKRIREDAIQRAGGRCEWRYQHLGEWWRCSEITNLTVHHLTYKRGLGNERPEELQVLCHAHHKAVEQIRRPWNWNGGAWKG